MNPARKQVVISSSARPVMFWTAFKSDCGAWGCTSHHKGENMSLQLYHLGMSRVHSEEDGGGEGGRFVTGPASERDECSPLGEATAERMKQHVDYMKAPRR